MFSNLSIGKRLGYASTFLLVLLLTVGITGYVGGYSLSNASMHAVKDQGSLASLASDINLSTLQLRRFEKDTFLNVEDVQKRDEYKEKWMKQADHLSQLLTKIAETLPNAAEKQRATDMAEQFREYQNGYREVLRGIADGSLKSPQQCNAKIAEYKTQVHALEDMAAKLNDDYEAQMAEQVPVISSIVSRTAWIIVIVTLLAVGVSIPLTMGLSRSITRPIASVVAIAKEVSRGHLDVALSEEKRRDEIGDLNKSFADMVAYLKELSAISSTIARGDLTVEVKPRSQEDRLSLSFLEMTKSLRDLVKSIRDTASQVASGSAQVAQASGEAAQVALRASTSIDEVTSTMHEMSTNSQSMMRNTEVQNDSVRETSASVEQMVVSIRRVDEHLRTLLDISRRSGSEVQTGIATSSKTNQGLDRIHKSIASSAEIITVLGERADNIGRIVEVIDDISEQTNLLALNAAIEAARAGENGLGFSVVADEVRKLAEKSAQSTKEIGELIQNIQKEARNAVRNMEQSTGIVNESMTLGSDLTRALSQIAQVVADVDKLTQEIGAASTEQSAGSGQIAVATKRLTQITDEISSAVEEQSAGARTVVETMERMQDVVKQSSSSASELSASAEQMSRMARLMVEGTNRFILERDTQLHSGGNGHGNGHARSGHSETERYAVATSGSYN